MKREKNDRPFPTAVVQLKNGPQVGEGRSSDIKLTLKLRLWCDIGHDIIISEWRLFL